MTIVNPADLAPALRESVCQQCHLQGWFRFPRAGRDFFDFRPGLPLHRFLAVFVRKESKPDRLELVGQVEQMESSRCFRASGGELGCISCHDPHRLPPPATKAEYYRGRCLECHEQEGLRPAGGRAAVAGPGRGLHRLPHAAPGRRGHPPHGDDRSPHPPRRRHTRPAARRVRRRHPGCPRRSSRGTITGI